jgi:hypothetical protein
MPRQRRRHLLSQAGVSVRSTAIRTVSPRRAAGGNDGGVASGQFGALSSGHRDQLDGDQRQHAEGDSGGVWIGEGGILQLRRATVNSNAINAHSASGDGGGVFIGQAGVGPK